MYYEGNKWNISDKKVIFKDSGEQKDKPIGAEGMEWWDELETLHDDIEVLEFTDIEISEEQLFRLEEVNKLSIPEGHSEIVGDYIKSGSFPDLPNHVLKDLQFTKMFNIMLGVE